MTTSDTATNDFAPDLPSSSNGTVDLLLAIQRQNAADRQPAVDLLTKTMEENKKLTADNRRLREIVNAFVDAEHSRSWAMARADRLREEGLL